jgi:CheY-like chemotaxis protein
LLETQKTRDHEAAILVIEDNEEMRGCITSILSVTNDLVFAEHGKQALELPQSINQLIIITICCMTTTSHPFHRT